MILPSFLRPGDTVGVVSPASWFPYDELADGLRILREDWQLTVIEGDSLQAIDGPFAGSDELRRADLQRLFDDPTVRAVFATRGGYGCYRIADELDLSGLQDNPKWLIGFSDVTVLLNLFGKNNIVSLHGLMARQFGDPDRAASLESVRQWLFGTFPSHYAVPPHPLNRPGVTEGTLVGGNLTMLINSIDTPPTLISLGKSCSLKISTKPFLARPDDDPTSTFWKTGKISGFSGRTIYRYARQFVVAFWERRF